MPPAIIISNPEYAHYIDVIICTTIEGREKGAVKIQDIESIASSMHIDNLRIELLCNASKIISIGNVEKGTARS